MEVNIGEELLNDEQKRSPYFVDDDGNLFRWKQTREGLMPQKISNFEACIVKEVAEDDGIEITYSYGIEGSCLKRPLDRINIAANSFHSMNWLTQWGSQAIIEPGLANKDFVRHAIQTRSNGVKKETCYTHTGWRKINSVWCYLSASGAIGADGISVRLSKVSENYALPLQPANETDTIKSSLSFLDLGPRAITLPLLVFTYLAPLTTLLGKMPNFSQYLYGETGVFKTELAKLCVNHFSIFSEIPLSSFEDTPNAIEKKAFELKDILHILDDYHPSYRKSEAQNKESLAQRIFREYSNRTARARLKSDTTARRAYIPRGLLLGTGEEVPTLQSTNARICVIEVSKGDIDVDRLTELQRKAHLLPHAMTSYIRWVRDHIEEIQEHFSKDFIQIREKAFREQHHLKVPEQVAFLQFSLDVVLNWLKDRTILTEEEVIEMSKDGWNIFCQLAERQSKRIEREDPVRLFAEILQTLITQGRIRLQSKTLGSDIIGGAGADLLGYYDDVFLYLLPTAIWHSINRFCITGGEHFPFSKQTFYRTLKSRNIIETDIDHSTKTEWINGKSQKVLKVRRERVGI